MHYIRNDDWFSLPEMTNHNGEYNAFSCRAQAWSVGSVLWAMDAVQNLQCVRFLTNKRIAIQLV